MLNQYEVPACMADELPELNEELKAISPALNIFKSVQCLANFTKRKAADHDISGVKQCFSLAEKIYFNGNENVKNAMENVFIFSFSSLLNACSREERNKLQSLMPLCLHTAYVQQVLRSGL